MTRREDREKERLQDKEERVFQQLLARTEREERQEARDEETRQLRIRTEQQRLEDKAEARNLHEVMRQSLQGQQDDAQDRACRAGAARRLKMGKDIPTLPKLEDPQNLVLFLKRTWSLS